MKQGGGDELVVFRIERPTAGVWTFSVDVKGDVGYGYINMWLPITQFLGTDTYFLRPSPYETLTEPSGQPELHSEILLQTNKQTSQIKKFG